jgi:hypothetical protein
MTPPRPHPTPHPPSRRGLRTALGVVAVALAACCLGATGGGFWLYRTWQGAADPARQAADVFLGDLARADYASAYEGLCPQIRAQVSRESFETAMRNHRQVRAHRIVDASVHTVDGRATGLVTVEVTYDDGAVERRTLTLTGDDGDWAVCGLPYQ